MSPTARTAARKSQGASIKIRKPEEEPLTLSLKVTIGSGEVCTFHVGGMGDASNPQAVARWEFLVTDRPRKRVDPDDPLRRQPFAQIADAEGNAEAGDVMLSWEAWELVNDVMDVVPSGVNYKMVNLLDTASEAYTAERTDFSHLPITIRARVPQMLRMHVLDNVRQRIEAGHQDFVNEVRICTVVFMGFPTLNTPMPVGSNEDGSPRAEGEGSEVEMVQNAMDVVLRKMQQYDGSITQFRCDEKGFLMICAFGLPGRTHEDDPKRAVQAALAVRAGMLAHGQEARIGLTTGQLFCACVGTKRRAEYTVFGDAINLSARLMCKSKPSEILCDSTTYELAKDTQATKFYHLDPIKVKGKEKMVAIYKVAPVVKQTAKLKAMMMLGQGLAQRLSAATNASEMTDSDESSREEGAHPDKHSFGREKELAALVARLQMLREGKGPGDRPGGGGVVVIEGDAGMGKSLLVAEAMRQEAAHVSGSDVFYSKGSSSNMYDFLYAWRRVFKELFALDRRRRGSALVPRSVVRQGSEGVRSVLRQGSKYIKDDGDGDDDGMPVTPAGPGKSRLGMKAGEGGAGGSKKDKMAKKPREAVPFSDRVSLHLLPWDFNQGRGLIAECLEMEIRNIPLAPTLQAASIKSVRTAIPHKVQARISQMNVNPRIAPMPSQSLERMESVASRVSSSVESNVTETRGGSMEVAVRVGAAAAKFKRGGEKGRKRKLLRRSNSESALVEQTTRQRRERDLIELDLLAAVDEGPAANSSRPASPRLSATVPLARKDSITGGLNLQIKIPRTSTVSSSVSSGLQLSPGGSTVMIAPGFSDATTPKTPTTRRRGSVVFQRASSFTDDAIAGSGALGLMTQGRKGEKIIELLLSVLWAVSESKPIVIILEDLHNFDTVSWDLLQAVMEECPKVLLVLTTRPLGYDGLDSSIQTAYERIVENPSSENIRLDVLNREAADRLIHAHLPLPDPALVDSIIPVMYEKSFGHPLFMEQMCLYVMQQKEQAESEGEDLLTLVGGANGLVQHIRNTVTIHSVITGRIDKLRPSEQLTLKLASVIGPSLELALMKEIHPMGLDLSAIEHDVQMLVKQKFIYKDASHGMVFHFQTQLAREVAYELIPFAQRQSLHSKLADALEAGYGSKLVSKMHTENRFATIAFHCTVAAGTVDDPRLYPVAERAINWWDRAAEETIQSRSEAIAHADIIRLYGEALRLADMLETVGEKSVTRQKRAVWELRVGSAYLAMGSHEEAMDEARNHLLESLIYNDVALPSATHPRISLLQRRLAIGCCGGGGGEVGETLVSIIENLVRLGVKVEDRYLLNYLKALCLYVSGGGRRPVAALKEPYGTIQDFLRGRARSPPPSALVSLGGDSSSKYAVEGSDDGGEGGARAAGGGGKIVGRGLSQKPYTHWLRRGG